LSASGQLLFPVHDIFQVPEGIWILFQASYYKIYAQLVKDLQALAIIGNKFPLDQASGNAIKTGFDPARGALRLYPELKDVSG
jgi:hypothetical protein